MKLDYAFDKISISAFTVLIAVLTIPSYSFAFTDEEKQILTQYEEYRQQLHDLENTKIYNEIGGGTGNPRSGVDVKINKVLQDLKGFMDQNGDTVKSILSQGEVHGGKIFDDLKAAGKNVYDPTDPKLLLLTPKELLALPPETVIHSVDGDKAIAGFREPDLETRNGHTGWGVKEASPEAINHVNSMTAASTSEASPTGHGVLRPTSNFNDFVKTNPVNGQPMLKRNGIWVTADQRLEELTKLIHKIIPGVQRTGPNDPDRATLAKEINKADIADNVFIGSKYDRKLADPKLAKIMEMEWYLGQGSMLLKKPNPRFGRWVNFGRSWFMKNSSNDKVIAEVLAKIKPAAAGIASVAKKGIVPAIAVLAGTTYLLSGSNSAEAASSVGAESYTPQQQPYQDDQFGPVTTGR